MIFDKNKVFIIAEIGGNHEGNFEYAKKLLLDAAKTGVDAVKFQIYHPGKLVSKIEDPNRYNHFHNFELTDDQYMELVKLSKENNVMFMASLWDLDSLEKFDPYIVIHKVGSGDLTNYPIIKAIAKKDKLFILSTAMSEIEEVRKTVEFINKINPNLIKENKFVLMHCVATYGNPRDEFANLLSIKKLQDLFPNLIIGYSDHTIGTYACEIAIGMGASVIEKHFTNDKTREFRDHQISLDSEEMKNLIKKAEKIKKLHGKYGKYPIENIETPQRIVEFRKAIYLKQDSPKGIILTKKNMITLRPDKGISANKFYEILGKKLKKDKKAFEAIYDEDLI